MMKLKNPLLNTFPRNPTQTDHLRFKRTPMAEFQSPFTDALDAFEGNRDRLLKRLPDMFSGGKDD